eukprot:symbB.v1.2.013835.t1/scaffold958.1/size148862/1
MRLKFQMTLAEPGEAVGVIAAQSMGEPRANVTLGIPRLREIIQTASRSCSTPLMSVPIIGVDKDGKLAPQQQKLASAQSLKRRFRKVTLMDCIARLVVNESIRLNAGRPVWIYHCHIEFMSLDELCKALFVPSRPVGSNGIMGAARSLVKGLGSQRMACEHVPPFAGGAMDSVHGYTGSMLVLEICGHDDCG